MPLPAFDSLFLSAARLDARDKADRLWEGYIAAQCPGADVKKLADALSKIDGQSDGENDASAFLQKFGSGF